MLNRTAATSSPSDAQHAPSNAAARRRRARARSAVRLALATTVVAVIAAAAGACSSSSSSSSSSGSNGADGGGSTQPLTVRFTSMYSLYDGVHVFTVPATVDGVQDATWSVSDPSLASIGPLTTESPSCGDALITTNGVGTVTVTAKTPDGRTGSAQLTITAPPENSYAQGVQRALYGETNAATGSGQPCINCHNDSSDIKHTPQQIGGFTDTELRNLIFQGQISTMVTIKHYICLYIKYLFIYFTLYKIILLF